MRPFARLSFVLLAVPAALHAQNAGVDSTVARAIVSRGTPHTRISAGARSLGGGKWAAIGIVSSYVTNGRVVPQLCVVDTTATGRPDCRQLSTPYLADDMGAITAAEMTPRDLDGDGTTDVLVRMEYRGRALEDGTFPRYTVHSAATTGPSLSIAWSQQTSFTPAQTNLRHSSGELAVTDTDRDGKVEFTVTSRDCSGRPGTPNVRCQNETRRWTYNPAPRQWLAAQ